MPKIRKETKAKPAPKKAKVAVNPKKTASDTPYVHVEKPDKTREVFESSVKKAGYKIVTDHGVPIAIVPKKDYPDAVRNVRELALAANFTKSWGCAPNSNKSYQGKGSDSVARYETNVVDTLSDQD